jgi:predicted ATP-grasp superfamily ATP-dependent carboligase
MQQKSREDTPLAVHEEHANEMVDDLHVPNHCTKYKIIKEYKIGDIILREFDTINTCNGATLLEGFPCEGLTSLIAANHVIKQLNLPPVGDVISRKFIPICFVKDGVPTNGVRIHGNDKICVFVSEFDLDEPDLLNDITTAILDFSKRHNIKHIISVDGIPKDPTKRITPEEKFKIQLERAEEDSFEEVDEESMFDADDEVPSSPEDLLKLLLPENEEVQKKIWFLTNDQSMGEKLSKMGHTPVVEMQKRGVTGGLLAAAPFSDISISCLFAPLNKHLQIGIKAAIVLLGCLQNLLGDEKIIDMSELVKTAKSIDEQIHKEVRKMNSSSDIKKAYSTSMYM